MSNRLSHDADPIGAPLAPPSQSQTSSARAAANAIVRFAHQINYGSRASASGDVQNRSHDAGTPRWNASPSSSPASTRTTTHRTGISIAALDISPCRSRAILAGRDILKIIAITDAGWAEDYNLKENFNRYVSARESSGGLVSARQRERIGAQDVKWSNGAFHTTVATAVSNGQIAIYDLNRVEVELARLHEHNRQVHKLAFNPHGGNLLLSGSQDATVRLWDLRVFSEEKSVATCQSRGRYIGNSEGVRDVKWCPADGFEFAMGTDSGTIQHWDTRKTSSPVIKVNAHEKMCSSIDWHPDGKHLLSASVDKRVNVWDLSSSNRRMKPVWQIRLPHAAANARWRPPSWSSDGHRPGNWQSTQLAVSFAKSPVVQVWDLHRPWVSSLSLDSFALPPTDLLWQSNELLWTVDSSGTFTQTDTLFERRTMDKRNLSPFAVAPDGRITFASMKEQPKRMSIEDVSHSLAQHERREIARGDKNRPYPGTSDGSHEEPNLLSSSFKNRRSKIPSSLRSEMSADRTPPSTGAGGPVDNLALSLRDDKRFRLQQVLGIGYVEGTFNADAFRFMARHYEVPKALPPGRSECNLHRLLQDFCFYNGKVADQAGQYQLAQTWKILGFAVENELHQRADRNRKRRVAYDPLSSAEITNFDQQRPEKTKQPMGEDLGDDVEQDLHEPRSPGQVQTSSNIHTPIIRPTLGAPVNFDAINNTALNCEPQPRASTAPHNGRRTGTTLAISDLATPTEELQKTTMGHRGGPLATGDSNSPKFLDMDRQMAERRAAMGNYRAQPRSLLRFDEHFHRSSPGPAGNFHQLDRQESNESFQMLTGSTDSSDPSQSNTGSFGTNVQLDDFGHIPEESPEDRRRRISGRPGQAENAITFDDEAEMAATKISPMSSHTNNDTAPPIDDTIKIAPEKAASPTSVSRPEQRQPALIHESNTHPNVRQLVSDEEAQAKPTKIQPGHFIEADFFVELESDQDDLSRYPPWTATALLPRLIEHYTETLFDAQFPTFLLLHLAPYFYVPFPRERARQIIQFYHDRLRSLELYTQAAEIRNRAFEDFPEIAEAREFQISTGGPWCTTCNKSNKGTKSGICQRCGILWDPCAVCHGKGPLDAGNPESQATFASPAPRNPRAHGTLWSWCQECGHGTHVSCRAVLWANPECEGACPVLGCLCDCGPGPRRERIHRRLRDEWKQQPPSIVARDDWDAKESSAVQRTRGLVGVSMSALTSSTAEVGKRPMPQQAGAGQIGPAKPIVESGGSGGSGPMSLSSVGRSVSGSKKVRIVEPICSPGNGDQIIDNNGGAGADKQSDRDLAEEEGDGVSSSAP